MDPFSLDEADTPERQAALAAALRRREDLGQLFQLTGDKVLAPLGQSLTSSADRGEQRLDTSKQRRLQLNLEAKKDQELQQYRGDTLQQHTDDMAQRSADRRLQLGMLGEQRAAAAAAREAAAVDRKAATEDRLDLRKSALTSGLSSKMKQDLDEGVFGGPVKAQVEASMRAEHLLKLAKKSQNGGFNNLTDAEQEELALGFGQLVAGGKPTAGQVAALLPPETLQSGAQGIKQWFKNEPLGRNQIPFTERYVHSIERQRDVARALIDKEKAQRLAAHRKLREMDPEQWTANVLAAGMDPTRLDPQGVYQVPEPPPEPGTMVDVINKDGVRGQIPAENLERAIKEGGFRRAP